MTGLLEARCRARLEEYGILRFSRTHGGDPGPPGGLWHWPSLYWGAAAVLDRDPRTDEVTKRPIPVDVALECGGVLASTVLVKAQWAVEILLSAGDLETLGGLGVVPRSVVGVLAGIVTDAFLPLAKAGERRRVAFRLYTLLGAYVTDHRRLAQKIAALVDGSSIRAPGERALKLAFGEERELFNATPDDPDLTVEEVMNGTGRDESALQLADSEGTRLRKGSSREFEVRRDRRDWVIAVPRGKQRKLTVRFRRRCEAHLLAAVFRLASSV